MRCRKLLSTALLSIIFCTHAMAETIRLAIVSEPSAGMINDLLTTELSHTANLQILERAQIDKVLREQTLAVTGSDHQNFLKVGQIVGADGVIALEIRTSGTNSALNARLIAVKPGVILGSLSAPWPLRDPIDWIKVVSGKFAPLWPKLTVLPKDAVPISVLNLRSAANSPDSRKIEQEMTLLLLNRLMQEKEVFVLERRKLGSLAEEKALKGIDDAPFWNGSFLADGVIDKDGFSKDQITINGRLVPPSGGAPIAIAVSGPRKDLQRIADDLAKKILAALQKKSSLSEWKPREEAAQFYHEAEWALKWGMLREAQAAAESAWALGQRDLPCADTRVRSYIYEVTAGATDLWAPAQFIDMNPFQVAPDETKLDQIRHAVELYYDYGRTLPANEPQINSSWYFTGVEALDAVGWVLQNYYFAPDARRAAEPKLAELRSMARETVALLYKSKSIHDAYWTGDRVDRSCLPKTDDEVDNFAKGYRGGSLSDSRVTWGCFWQETPEDCIALYRELLTSDVFSYFIRSLWYRGPYRPRLTAWRSGDEKRIPELWNRFLIDLKGSTNFVHQIDAHAFLMLDAKNDQELEGAFNDLFATVLAHTNDIAKHNCDFRYQWMLPELIGRAPATQDMAIEQKTRATKTRLRQKFEEEYSPKLAAIRGVRIEYLSGAKMLNKGPNSRDGLTKIASLEALPTTNTLPITRFLAIPQEQLHPSANDIEVVAHKFRDGKLWLELQYHTERPVENEYWHAAFAALDSASGTWQIIKRPITTIFNLTGGRFSDSGEGPHFEIFHGAIYCSEKKAWHKYDLKTKRWEILSLPGQTRAQFFAIDDHLYATTSETIFEVINEGQSTRTLASTRRRPPENGLDSLSGLLTSTRFPRMVLNPHNTRGYRQNSPMLFRGPNHSLRANVGKIIYSFDGKTWTETAKLPIAGIPELSDDNTAIIRPINESTAQVWILPNNQTNLDFAFEQENPGSHAPPTPEQEKESPKGRNIRPLWTPAADFPLMTRTTTLNSNLYFLIDCARVRTNSDGKREIDGTIPQMRLACFDREFSTPLIVPIHFDQHQGPTPSDRATAQWAESTAPWISFASGNVFIGNLDTPGIWVASASDMTTALNREKQKKSPKEIKAKADLAH